ncbi:hypothetical protein JD844_007958 [Phrynosoma platyrhinos]|uniref:Uncharacterized protein n=1 Tax=Phrynosoma platyrhinos TaxID=52577 RepID=A0ABQ7T443_PHRPL|nr:hypothetical protein JD844_007958 [Phrynosoma platyrhinos]
MLGLIAVVLLVVHFTLKFWKVQKRRQLLPPGPPPLPVLGNLWELNFSIQEDKLHQIAKVYGNSFTLWMKESPLIVLNGFSAVKDGFTTYPEDLSERPASPFYRDLAQGKEDDTFHRLMEVSFSFSAGGAPFKLYDLLPRIIRNVPGPHKKKFAPYAYVRSFVKEEIKIHKANRTPGEPRDFIDCYLDQIEKNAEDPGSSFDEENMAQSITDLFFGGSESSATTMHWALLYMVAYPDVQAKVRKELEDVLGNSQTISYEDRERLPYTNAVIHEIQRFSKVVPTTFRRCMRDTVLNGFPMKKGTSALFNLASALYDPKQWKNPQQFDPNHFLDKSGNFLNREAFLQFGAVFFFYYVPGFRPKLFRFTIYYS